MRLSVMRTRYSHAFNLCTVRAVRTTDVRVYLALVELWSSRMTPFELPRPHHQNHCGRFAGPY